MVIYNLSGDGPPSVDTYLALSTREELQNDNTERHTTRRED